MPKEGRGSISQFPLDADRLRRAAEAAGIRTLLHLEETGSTMDAARRLVEEGSMPLPGLVVADRQPAGRGRRGSGWWLPPGGLAATVVHDVGFLGGGSPIAAWSIACGVAMAEAIGAARPGLAVAVKWPNDVLVGERKLAGCLVETLPRGRGDRSAGAAALFGVGVNTSGRAAEAPPELRERVATLPDLAGDPLSRPDLLAAFLPRLESLCRAITARPSTLVERYEPLCGLAGRTVALHTSTATGPALVRGRCLGIDADGALRLLTARGVERFVSGSLTRADA
jgi:BirA family biotin operon repressor/biotin-[acetyl-CoA-carboxylase] ligase